MDSFTILVLGATGGSGLAFIDEVLQTANPPRLILYVRTPSKLPQDLSIKPGVSIITGQLSEENLLNETMKDHSVTTVVSFLGAYVSPSAIITRNKDTPIADSFPSIITAMKKSGVRHLMALSTPAHWVEGRDVSTMKMSLYSLMPTIFAPQGNAEMLRIGEVVSSVGQELDWTIFRVPHLTDGAADLAVYAGYAGPTFQGGFNLSRKSLARWVMGEIREREWKWEAPFLGNQ